MNRQSLDDRLRHYLVEGAHDATPADLEDRVLARSAGHRRAASRRLILQTLGATAFVIALAAVALGVHLSRPMVQPAVTPPPTTTRAPFQGTVVIESIDMKTTRSGWASAYQMPAGAAGAQRRMILRTTDGGQHWRNVTPADSWQPSSAWFLDDSTAWTVSVHQAADISIMRTVDGGAHWQESTVADLAALDVTYVEFSDAAQGWLFVSHGAAAGSEGGALYRTTDGGVQWERVAVTSNAPGQLPFGGDKNGLAFINSSTGWLTGSSAAPAPFFYASHDGGSTWHRQDLAVPAGVEIAGTNVAVPRFFSATAGEFEIDANRTVVYVTEDGGATWTPRLGPALGKAFFLNESTGWLVSHDGKAVYTTTDGGKTWNGHQPDRLLGQLYALDFVSNTTGFAILASGTGHPVLVTKDGGLTWRDLNPSVD